MNYTTDLLDGIDFASESGQIRLMLNEAGKIPLLTKDQELSIFDERDKVRGPYMIQAAIDYVEEKYPDLGPFSMKIQSHKVLFRKRVKGMDPSEVSALLEMRDSISPKWWEVWVEASEKQFSDLRDKVVRANILLVVSQIKWDNTHKAEFKSKGSVIVPWGMTMDAISEGTLGLFRAFELYDPELAARQDNDSGKFSTYATPWIQQFMRRYIVQNQQGAVRLPVYRAEMVQKLVNIIKRIHPGNVYDSIQMILAAPDKYIPEILEMANSNAAKKINEEKVLGACRDFCLRYQSSLDERFDSSDIKSKEGYDYYASGQDVQGEAEINDITAMIQGALDDHDSGLTAREAKVLALRYGFNGYEEHVLGSIGEKFGLTRERARQIEKEGLTKLRTYFANRGIASSYGVFA